MKMTSTFWRGIAAGAGAAVLAICAAAATAPAADAPQWGEARTRNLVSPETGLPDSFDPATGKNIKWSVRLGDSTHSTPVIAAGKVLVGTNNDQPRDPRHQGDRGVLMCFDEKDGKFNWQLVVPKRVEDIYLDWPSIGIVSSPVVEGDRVYVVTNRAEVACLDIAGMANGNDGPFKDEGRHMTPAGRPALEAGRTDADILWLFDMASVAHQHDAAHACVLVHGQFLYVNTCNGVDKTHLKVPEPGAPSLVVLDKATGRYLARDRANMGPRTIHSTWSSPGVGEVGGRPLVFFGGGDGLCYAFEALAPPPAADGPPAALKEVWRFDCDPAAPRENVHQWQENRREGPSNISGMPVFYKNRIYITAGGDFWHGKPASWLKCIDAAASGDITRTGQLWSFTMPSFCVSTPSIQDGLVYIADAAANVHCLDAETGRAYWSHKARGETWASTLVADGKVYLATRTGKVVILAAGRQEKVLSTVDMKSPISGSPVAANGVLYVTTMTHLYAVQRTDK